MSLFVLDTDHLTLLRKAHPVVSIKAAAMPAGRVATTLITVDEQLSGWYSQLRKARDAARLAKAFRGLLDVVEGIKLLPVLEFTIAAAQR